MSPPMSRLDTKKSGSALTETCLARSSQGWPQTKKRDPTACGQDVGPVSLCDDDHGALRADDALWQAARFGGYQPLGFLLGELRDSPGASTYMHKRCGAPVGVPSTDLEAEKRLAALLCEAVAEGLVRTAIAVAAGGLLPALAKACIRSAVGATITLAPSARPHLQLFGEHPAQAVIAAAPAAVKRLYQRAETYAVPMQRVGEIGGTMLDVHGCGAVALATLAAARAEKPSMGRSHAA